MSRCRVVRPETVKVTISDGDWVELKKRLTYGEKARMMRHAVEEVRGDGTRTLDIEMVRIAPLVAYIVDWSLEDAKGKRIAIDAEAKLIAALRSFDDATVEELGEAVNQHTEAMADEEAAAKNVQGTSSASAATS